MPSDKAVLLLILSDNLLKAVFTGPISNYLDEIEQLEKAVGQNASVAEAQGIIQQLYHEKACNVDSMKHHEQGSRIFGCCWTISARQRHGLNIEWTTYSSI